MKWLADLRKTRTAWIMKAMLWFDRTCQIQTETLPLNGFAVSLTFISCPYEEQGLTATIGGALGSSATVCVCV